MTPWQLAKDSEHSHQRAIMAWSNCVARFGFAIASQPEGYKEETRDKLIANWKDTPWGSKQFQLTPVPELRLLFAIHNQGHGDAIRGNRAKAEGVKAGVPDLMLPVMRDRWLGDPVAGLFIELKPIQTFTRKDKGRAAGVQIEWITELRAQGYQAEVCHGWIAAANLISEYMGASVRVYGQDPD